MIVCSDKKLSYILILLLSVWLRTCTTNFELQLFIVFYTESLISHFPLLHFIYCLSLLFLFTLLSIPLFPYFSRSIFLSFVTGSSSFLLLFFLSCPILLWHLLHPLLYSICFLTVTSTTPSSLFHFLTVTSTTPSS